MTVAAISAAVVVSICGLGYIACMSLRDKVEKLLPNWERWYPSLFDAASDLGVIKARVCDPNSLLLSNRHAAVQQQAEEAHREKWGYLDSE
ncbi:MAG TPA: hypothetical protein VLB07_01565 [Woeseiaceae bacterium]|nr:hypothetical protein [Woeseiaceae bacterium]